MSRLATEEELDSLSVDVWSYRKGEDGFFIETGRQTLTLREAARLNPGYKPTVIDRVLMRARVQRTGDDPV